VWAADRLPAIRRFCCEWRRLLSTGDSGCCRLASISSHIAAGWEAADGRLIVIATIPRPLCKAESCAQRGRTSLHSNYDISLLVEERVRCQLAFHLLQHLSVTLGSDGWTDTEFFTLLTGSCDMMVLAIIILFSSHTSRFQLVVQLVTLSKFCQILKIFCLCVCMKSITKFV